MKVLFLSNRYFKLLLPFLLLFALLFLLPCRVEAAANKSGANYFVGANVGFLPSPSTFKQSREDPGSGFFSISANGGAIFYPTTWFASRLFLEGGMSFIKKTATAPMTNYWFAALKAGILLQIPMDSFAIGVFVDTGIGWPYLWQNDIGFHLNFANSHQVEIGVGEHKAVYAGYKYIF